MAAAAVGPGPDVKVVKVRVADDVPDGVLDGGEAVVLPLEVLYSELVLLDLAHLLLAVALGLLLALLLGPVLGLEGL